MEKMHVEDLEEDINAARDKLKEMDEKIVVLSGRLPRNQRHIQYDEHDDSDALNNKIDRKTFGLDERRLTINRDFQKNESTGGAIRRRVSIESRIERRQSYSTKRQRDEDQDDEEDFGKRQKSSIQSTVVMPALDSKGRDEKIEKLKKDENKEVNNRNRRMFSNLLMGTLNTFKKTDRKTTQQQKQEEVEKKLEQTKRDEEEKRHSEKSELLHQKRQQETELNKLQRKKALIQYANIKIDQLEKMKGAVKTSAHPVIYWQPAKHTPRSMELQTATERYLDDLIRKRKEQLEEELAAKEAREVKNKSENDGENGEEDEYDDMEEEEEVPNGNTVKSIVKIEETAVENIEVVLKSKEDVENEELAKKSGIVEEEDEVHVELD